MAVPEPAMAPPVAARRRAAGSAPRAPARRGRFPSRDEGSVLAAPVGVPSRQSPQARTSSRPASQPVRAILISACAGLLTLAVTSSGAPAGVVALGVAALTFAVHRTARQRVARAVSRLEA